MRVAYLSLLLFVVIVTAISSVFAQAQVNEVYINPDQTFVGQGNQFIVGINAKVPITGPTDIYGIQYDIMFDEALLDFVSISEGDLLDDYDTDPTEFGYSYTPGSGLIDDIYIVRNKTFQDVDAGVFNPDEVTAFVTFDADLTGEGNIDLNEIIWVNSTITNDSATEFTYYSVTNGTVTSGTGGNNQLYVNNPGSSTIDQGQQITFEIKAMAPIGASDIHSLQFDLIYDPTVLSVFSVTEGPMIGQAGAVSTFFGFDATTAGVIDTVYVVRDATTGVFDDDNITVYVTFDATGAGTTQIGLNEVIWTNSTADNISVGQPDILIITNDTLTVNPIAPTMGDVECEINGGDNWVPNCGGIIFYDDITRVRVACSTTAGSVDHVDFRFENLPDSNVFFDQSTSSEISGYWTFDNNPDVVINDSGAFNLSATCVTTLGAEATRYAGMNMPWGRLVPVLVDPTSDTNKAKDDFFSFTSTVICMNGECGDVEALLDPFSCGAACEAYGGSPGGFGCTDIVLGPACTPPTHQCDGGNTVEDIHVGTTTGAGSQTATGGEVLSLDIDYECWGPGSSDEITVWYHDTNSWQMIYNLDVSASGNCDGGDDGAGGFDGTASTTFTVPDITGTHTIRVFETDWDPFWDQETNPCPTTTQDAGQWPYGDFDDVLLYVTASGPGPSPIKTVGQAVSTVPDTKPFYTTDPNPRLIANTPCLQDMKIGDSCSTTWQVNATGDSGNEHEFYTIYTPTSYPVDVNTNETAHVNITILGGFVPQDNTLYISPTSPAPINQFDQITFEIRATAPADSSDIHSIQFDVIYDETILSVNSVIEGPMLNQEGAVSTFFGYDDTTTPGVIDTVFVSRDSTTGVFDDDNITVYVTFDATGVGSSQVGLTEVIWTNSTADNETVGVPYNLIISNSSITVNAGSDTTPPSDIDFVSPTPSEASTPESPVTVQVTFTEVSPNNCIFQWNNGTSSNFTTAAGAGTCSYDFASADGAVNVIVFVDDVAGNINNTNIRSFTITTPLPSDNLVIFDDDYGNPAAYSGAGEFVITSNDVYAGTANLEHTPTGGWDNLNIHDIDIPLTNITDWSTANLTFAIKTSSALGYIEVHLFNDLVPRDQYTVVFSTSTSGYEVKTIPLTDFATSSAAFGGSLIEIITFGSTWPGAAVYMDEIMIEDGVPADTTPPSAIDFVPPTPDMSSTVANPVPVQITFVEASPSTCTFQWNNGTETNITVAAGANSCSADFMSATGTIILTAYVGDTAGNMNNTDVRVFTVDADPPGPVTGLGETATGTDFITWSWTNPIGGGMDHIEVWLDGVFDSNVSGPPFTANGLSPSTTYTLSLRTADVVGNAGSWVNDSAATIGVDTTDPNIYFNAGTPADNTYTNQSNVLIDVEVVEPNLDDIILSWAGTEETNTMTNTGGDTWEITKVVSIDQWYDYYVWANDTYGNSNQTETRRITYDTTIPDIFMAPSDTTPQGIHSQDYIKILALINEANMDTAMLNWQGVDEPFDEIILGVFYNTTKYGLADGTYTFYGWATDLAGNYNRSGDWIITLDTTPPFVDVETPEDGLAYAYAPTLDFTTTDVNTIVSCEYRLNGGANTTIPGCGNGTVLSTGLQAGVNNLDVYVLDEAGNLGYAWVWFTYDTQSPQVNIFEPQNITYASAPVLDYSTNDNEGVLACSYELDGADNVTLAGCANNTLMSTSDGPHHVRVWILDYAGNADFDDMNWVLDTSSPTVNYDTPPTPTNGVHLTSGLFTISVTADETINTCTVTIDSVPNAGNVNGNNCDYSASLGEGVHMFNVTATDFASNSGITSDRIVTIDTTDPSVMITYPVNANFYNDTPMLMDHTYTELYPGTCEFNLNTEPSNTTITCGQNGIELPFGDLNNQGANNILRLYMTDQAGNLGTFALIFFYDTIPPGDVTGLTNTSSGTTYINWVWNNPATDYDNTEIWIDGVYNSSTTGTSFNATGLLSGGLHTISLRAFDATGNAGNWVNDSKYTQGVDTTPPTLNYAVPPTPADGTWQTTNTFTFRIDSDEALTSCTLTLDSTPISLTPQGVNLDYCEYTSGVLSEGTHTFSAVADDLQSNTGTLPQWSFDIDTQPPSGVVFTVPQNATYSMPINMGYSYTETNPDVCEYNLNNAGTNTTFTCGNNPLLPSTQGPNYLEFYITDLAGHTGMVGVSYTYDDIDPVPDFVPPTPIDGTYIPSNSFTVTVDANEPLSICTLTFDSSDTPIIPTGSSCSDAVSSLSEGAHTFNMTVEDGAGNTNITNDRTVYVDTVDPTVSFTSSTPDDANITNNQTVVIRVLITEPNIDRIVLDWNGNNDTNSMTQQGNEWYTVKTMATEQIYSYYVWVQDLAGNEMATETRTITYDGTAPTVTFVSPPTPVNGTFVDGSSYAFETLFNEEVVSGGLYIDGSYETGFGGSVGTTSYTFNNNFNTDGVRSFYVTATDHAGNTGTSEIRQVIRDTTPPSVQIDDPQNTTYNTSVVLDQTYSELYPDVCEYTLNGVVTPITCGQSGITLSPIQGPNHLYLTSTDLIGNSDQDYVSFIYDTLHAGEVSGLGETSTGSDFITWEWTNPTEFPDFEHVEIWIDNVFQTSTTAEIYTATPLSSGGTFEIQIRTKDTNGNVGPFITDTAQTPGPDLTPPTITFNSPPTPTDGAEQYDTAITVSITADETLNSCILSFVAGPEAGTNITITPSGMDCSWTTTVAEGTSTYIMFADDTVGNRGSSLPRDIVIDQTAPSITINEPPTPADGLVTSTQAATINIDVIETNTLTQIDLGWDGANNSMANIGGDTWERTEVMTEGTHTYYVWTVDLAGNADVTAMRSVTYDVTPPTLAYEPTSTTSTYWNKDWIMVNVSMTDVNPGVTMLQWNRTNNSTFANNDGEYYWTNTTGLSDDLYTYYAYTTDQAFNYVQLEERSITIDLTSPTVEIIYPANITNSTVPVLNLTASDVYLLQCYYSLNGAANSTPTTCDALNGTVMTSNEGKNNVSVYATDLAGNIGGSTRHWTHDTTPPNNVWQINNFTFNYTSIEWHWSNPTDVDHNQTEIWIDGVLTTVVADSVTAYVASGLSSGYYHEIGMRTVDLVGNINQTWMNHSAMTNASMPIVNITNPYDGQVLNISNINATWVMYGVLTDVDHAKVDLDSTGSWPDMQGHGYYMYTGVVDGSHLLEVWLVNSSNGTIPNSESYHNITFTVDATTPSLHNVSALNVTYEDAIIEFDASENVDGLFEWSTNISDLSNTIFDSGMASHHSYQLSGLADETTFYYNITACDAARNCNTTGPNSFTTGTAPEDGEDCTDGIDNDGDGDIDCDDSDCSGHSACNEDPPDPPPPDSYCGDGNCDSDETPSNCPADCIDLPDPPRTVYDEFDLDPGTELAANTNLQGASGLLLGSTLSSGDVNQFMAVSGNISGNFTGNRTMYAYNETTNLTTSLTYDGSNGITNLIVYEDIPTVFASNSNFIDVNSNAASYGIVSQNPEYIFMYPTVATSDSMAITYDVDYDIADLLAVVQNAFTEVYAETISLPVCNNDGTCDPGENQQNCPADCTPTTLCVPNEVLCVDGNLEICHADGMSATIDECPFGCDEVTNTCLESSPFDYMLLVYVAVAVIALLVVVGGYMKLKGGSQKMSWNDLKSKWTKTKTAQQENLFNVSTVLTDPDMFVGKTVKMEGNISLSNEYKQTGDMWYVFDDSTGTIPVHTKLRGLNGKGLLIGMIEKTSTGQVYINMEEFDAE